MKKTLVFTLILTLILSVVSFVSATEGTTEPTEPETTGAVATIKVENTTNATVEEGGTVKATVSFSEPVRSATVYINYEAAVLELVGMPEEMSTASMKAEESDSTAGHKGYTFTGANDGITELTYVFKTAEGAKVGDKTNITVSGKFINKDAVSSTKIAGVAEVTIIEKASTEPGNTDITPTNPEQQGSNPSDNGKEEPKEERPTRYPQTGVNVLSIAGAVVLAIVAGYVVTKKTK